MRSGSRATLDRTWIFGHACARMSCVIEGCRRERERQTVLVVDCEPISRTVFVKMLERSGYEVLEAANASDAIKICRDGRHHIDLLIAEFLLPDSKGTDLASEIRNHCRDVPILLTSGTPLDRWSEVHRVRFSELGSRTDFLPKPFQYSALDSMLRHLFSSK